MADGKRRAVAPDCVKVFGRFRPLETGAEPAPWKVVDRLLSVPATKGLTESEFSCKLDAVFDEHSTQEEVYQATAEPGVSDFVSGVNATIFAYGQTGTGKTYSMYGPDEVLRQIQEAPPDQVLQGSRAELHGCALRAVRRIFDHLAKRPGSALTVAYLEGAPPRASPTPVASWTVLPPLRSAHFPGPTARRCRSLQRHDQRPLAGRRGRRQGRRPRPSAARVADGGRLLRGAPPRAGGLAFHGAWLTGRWARS